MDEVKRKIYLDLFASPISLIPIVGGLTALLATWSVGGPAWWTFAGLAGVFIGVGTLASRLIFGLEDIADRAYQYQMEKHQADRDAALGRIEAQLAEDEDPRTQQLFSRLMRIYRRVEVDIREGRIRAAAQGVVESVEQMFQVCVEYLQRAYELSREAGRLTGRERNRVQRQREELVTEVEQSVEFLAKKLDQLEAPHDGQHKSELARLRAELDESIRVARQAEARLEKLVDADGTGSILETE